MEKVKARKVECRNCDWLRRVWNKLRGMCISNRGRIVSVGGPGSLKRRGKSPSDKKTNECDVSNVRHSSPPDPTYILMMPRFGGKEKLAPPRKLLPFAGFVVHEVVGSGAELGM